MFATFRQSPHALTPPRTLPGRFTAGEQGSTEVDARSSKFSSKQKCIAGHGASEPPGDRGPKVTANKGTTQQPLRGFFADANARAQLAGTSKIDAAAGQIGKGKKGRRGRRAKMRC